MTDEQIIEAAIQGHASTREAIRWAMKQVRCNAEPIGEYVTKVWWDSEKGEMITEKIPLSYLQKNDCEPVILQKPLTEQEINDLFEQTKAHKESFQWPHQNWFQAGFAIAELVYGIGGGDDSRK